MRTEPPFLALLAEWCASPGPLRHAAGLRERIGTAALDWLGAVAAGRNQPAAAAYVAAYHRLDPAGSSPAERAFLLGALSHLAEVDDGHRLATVHPGVVSFSPLWALGRETGLSAGAVRAGIVAGYEASVRLGASFGSEHYRVFHTTATAGSFGAAAATAVATGLDASRILDAFGHAGTQAAGVWQFLDDGAEVAKAAHAGFAARNGLSAALLGGSGLAGARHILEGPRGLAAAWQTRIAPEPLEAPFVPESSALATSTIKAWPVCGQMHHVLDAALCLAREGLADPLEIRSIEISSFPALERIAGIPEPATPAQARFSTAYCVAHVLVHKELEFGALSGTDLPPDGEVRRVAARVQLTSDPRFDAAYPRQRACRITLRMQGGREHVLDHVGRHGDPEHPFSRAELDERFDDIAASASASWREAARSFCFRLETAPDHELIPREAFRDLVDE